MKTQLKSKKIVVFSHILPAQPSAGNEVRLAGLLKRLKMAGARITLVFAPLGPGDLDERRASQTRRLVDELLIIKKWELSRDEACRWQEKINKEEKGFSQKLRQVQEWFCPQMVLAESERLLGRRSFDVVLAEYIFFTRSFWLFPDAVGVVDLHDLFSTKKEKVEKYGIKDDLCLSTREEKSLIKRADLVLTIQDEERRRVEEWGLKNEVITVGVGQRLRTRRATVHRKKKTVVMMVASDNQLNKAGLTQFLKDVWAPVAKKHESAEFWILGKVHPAGPVDSVEKCKAWGFQKELSKFYEQCDIVVNPVIAGTGLKIKSIEALGHGCPLVAFENGIDGIRSGNTDEWPFLVARDWKQFRQHLEQVISDEELRGKLSMNAPKFMRRFLRENTEQRLVDVLTDRLS